MADVPKLVRGLKFMEALVAAGVIRHEDRVRRVVIDVPVDGPVVVYAERYGDERLLDVATTLEGVQVVKSDG